MQVQAHKTGPHPIADHPNFSIRSSLPKSSAKESIENIHSLAHEINNQDRKMFLFILGCFIGIVLAMLFLHV